MNKIEPATLLCLREAAKLIPSATRPGHGIHIQRLARWCQTGRIRAVKRGRFWFVRPEDIEALYKPHAVQKLEPVRREVPAHVVARLRAMGVM